MNEKFELLTELIHSRRAIFPQNYKPGKISAEILESILENARWAPNHKKTEPWRFVLIENDSLKDLSEFLSNRYKLNTSAENFDPVKFKKAGEKPLQSAAVLAICIPNTGMGRNSSTGMCSSKYLVELYRIRNWILLEQSGCHPSYEGISEFIRK